MRKYSSIVIFFILTTSSILAQKTIIMTDSIIMNRFDSNIEKFYQDTSFFFLMEAQRTLRWYTYDNAKTDKERQKEVFEYVKLLKIIESMGLDTNFDVSNPLETPTYRLNSYILDEIEEVNKKRVQLEKDILLNNRKVLVGRVFEGFKTNFKNYYQLFFLGKGEDFTVLKQIITNNYDQNTSKRLILLFQLAINDK